MSKQHAPPQLQRVLRDGLLFSAALYPEKEAILIGEHSYTYSELLNAALCVASSLTKLGIKRDNQVAIYMDNTWPCVVSIYAVMLAGATFLTINPQTKSDKLEYILRDSESKILITDVPSLKPLRSALDQTKHIVAVISAGKDTTVENGFSFPVFRFEKIISNSTELTPPVDIIPNDLAALIYTSGSTGFPKGVMQTHQSMVFAVGSLIEYLRLSPHDQILLVLPIAFDYGLYQLLMSVSLGATLVIERSFTFPVTVYKTILNKGVTVFPAVPTILAMMIASHKKKALSFPSVRRLTNTAAALTPGFIPYLHEIFPNALIFKMYGLTECKRVCYLEPELIDLYPGSVGRSIPGTETYLLNTEGQPVPVGESGILYVRGPHIMAGYWKQKKLSEHMLKPGPVPGEQVLCTQDYFRIDENDLLYFVGRTDDIIKTRGEKVSPVEVENVLLGLSGINEASVLGVFDGVLGQVIRAFIVVDSNSTLTEKEIKRYCLTHIENFMVPKYIVFLDALPKTSNGKIDTLSLKDWQDHE